MGLFMIFFLSLLFIAAIVGSSIIQTAVLSMMGSYLPVNRLDVLKLSMAPGFMAAALLCGLVSIRFLPRRGQLRWPSLPAIALLPLLLQIVAAPLYNLSLSLFPPGELFYSLMETLQPTGHPLDTFGAFFSIALIGPICEEFVFRGVMMERALRERRNMHLVVVLQALLFGIAHMNPWQFFYAVAFGVLFGYLRVWTGGLSLTILLHMLVNGWSVLSSYIELPLFQESTDGEPVPIEWWIVIVSLAIGAALVWSIYRFRERPQEIPVAEISV